ncbi:MAG: hypothetical protein J5I90_07760 [Caldilineales bacterium]|nr:hypothetical protein [Caldilineales bacterium]
MRVNLRLFLGFVSLIIALAGCAPVAMEPAPTPANFIPLETTQPEEAPHSPLPTPTQEPLASMPNSAESAPESSPDAPAVAAQSIAADALDVTPADVTVVEVEQIDWNDSSLGCPQPDYLYAQVITPGYKVTVEVAGETHFVHMDMSGHGVLCTDPQ